MSEVKPVAKIVDASGHRCAIEWFYPEYRSDGTLLYSAEVVEELRAAHNSLEMKLASQEAKLEASHKELGYAKMAADAEAKFADEYKAKFEAQVSVNEQQAKLLNQAFNRINDMLQDDDGQAHKEARKFVESLSAQKGTEQ